MILSLLLKNQIHHNMKTNPLYQIENNETKDKILFVLSDRYCRTIIESIIDKPMSAIEITAKTKIPISTVYRRLHELEKTQLLNISGAITDDKKKFFLYKSRIKGIQTNFSNGNLEINLIFNL